MTFDRFFRLSLGRLGLTAALAFHLGGAGFTAQAGEQHKAPHVYDFRHDAKLDKHRRDVRRDNYKQNRTAKRTFEHKDEGMRVRDWRADRRRGLGDWRGYEPSTDRARFARLRRERHEREERARRERHRQNRHHYRTHRSSNWNNYGWNGYGWNRYTRNMYGYNNRYSSRNRWWDHRDWNYWRGNSWLRSGWRTANWRRYPYRPWQYTGQQGWRTRYNSPVGISFFFGTAGYSRYRWASNPYRFYQPQYGSRAGYQANTWCERVLVDAQHYDHTEIVSVLQCSNPWDGTYIIEGSEQVVDCPYRRD